MLDRPTPTIRLVPEAPREPDAFLGGDLVARRAVGARTPREAEARARAWRPWRGHALVHLWTREVFA